MTAILLLTWFWLPVENIGDTEKQHNARIPSGRKRWLNLTPGSGGLQDDTARFGGDSQTLRAGRWNYDKWSAAQLVSDLVEYDDLPWWSLDRSFGWMNAPTKNSSG